MEEYNLCHTREINSRERNFCLRGIDVYIGVDNCTAGIRETLRRVIQAVPAPVIDQGLLRMIYLGTEEADYLEGGRSAHYYDRLAVQDVNAIPIMPGRKRPRKIEEGTITIPSCYLVAAEVAKQRHVIKIGHEEIPGNLISGNNLKFYLSHEIGHAVRSLLEKKCYSAVLSKIIQLMKAFLQAQTDLVQDRARNSDLSEERIMRQITVQEPPSFIPKGPAAYATGDFQRLFDVTRLPADEFVAETSGLLLCDLSQVIELIDSAEESHQQLLVELFELLIEVLDLKKTEVHF